MQVRRFALQRSRGGRQKSRAFYRILGEAVSGACLAAEQVSATPRVVHLDKLDPVHVADQIDRLGKSVDAIAIVAADHPRIAEAIERLHERRVPVFALISELSGAGRIGYVGLASSMGDLSNRQASR
jgi:LacI family transcriptional regulator